MTSAIYSETAPLVPEILHPDEKRRKLMCHSSSSTHVDKRRRRPRTTSTVKNFKRKISFKSFFYLAQKNWPRISTTNTDYYELRWINKFNHVLEITTAWLGKALNNCPILELNNFPLLSSQSETETATKPSTSGHRHHELFRIVRFLWIEQDTRVITSSSEWYQESS